MTYLNKALVFECLEQLKNRELQENLWLGKVPNQQSSFEEAVAGLFDDSGLGIALEKGETGFSAATESRLRELSQQLSKVRARAPAEILRDLGFARVRDLAANILELMTKEKSN